MSVLARNYLIGFERKSIGVGSTAPPRDQHNLTVSPTPMKKLETFQASYQRKVRGGMLIHFALNSRFITSSAESRLKMLGRGVAVQPVLFSPLAYCFVVFFSIK